MKLETDQAKICPLCQKENHCGMINASSTEACWCFKESFPKEIFDQLPPEREKVCICKNCLVKFKS